VSGADIRTRGDITGRRGGNIEKRREGKKIRLKESKKRSGQISPETSKKK
jgi:hypothetical protein